MAIWRPLVDELMHLIWPYVQERRMCMLICLSVCLSVNIISHYMSHVIKYFFLLLRYCMTPFHIALMLDVKYVNQIFYASPFSLVILLFYIETVKCMLDINVNLFLSIEEQQSPIMDYFPWITSTSQRNSVIIDDLISLLLTPYMPGFQT